MYETTTKSTFLGDKLQTAVSDKEEAEDNVEELQDEVSVNSMVTKGLLRQVKEKITRLQNDLERSRPPTGVRCP
jgi:hypothetical protein